MNKLLKASLAGLLLATTALHAQIEINDNISVTGFVDMSVSKTDSEMTRSNLNNGNDSGRFTVWVDSQIYG